MLRYVDDYFSAERAECCQHAMLCFARLVRCVLGSCAISDKKLEWGMPLTILGLSISLNATGAFFVPDRKKVSKWKYRIEAALSDCRLTCGQASKLAGALSWAASALFFRLGRAMLRPIFMQSRRKSAAIGRELELALRWWLEALASEWKQERTWAYCRKPFATLLCDARGSPPRVAAVLAIDGMFVFTDCQPDAKMLSFFTPRGDNQILGLELLSIALGLSTFGHLLRYRAIRIFSDNVGSEHATAVLSIRYGSVPWI